MATAPVKITCPTCKGDLATCGHGAQPWSMREMASAHRSLIDAGLLPCEPGARGRSEAKCEECGAYYPHHLTRNCQGEHVEPVK
jgi:hypothetical protein